MEGGSKRKRELGREVDRRKPPLRNYAGYAKLFNYDLLNIQFKSIITRSTMNGIIYFIKCFTDNLDDFNLVENSKGGQS